MLKRFLAVLFGTAIAASAPAADRWVEGGLYVTEQESGRFVPLKILKVDEQGVHVRVYSNVFRAPPRTIDESTLYMAGMDRRDDERLGMGHLPISRASFSDWNVRFVQQSSVSAEELEGYNMWRDAEGGYF